MKCLFCDDYLLNFYSEKLDMQMQCMDHNCYTKYRLAVNVDNFKNVVSYFFKIKHNAQLLQVIVSNRGLYIYDESAGKIVSSYSYQDYDSNVLNTCQRLLALQSFY